MCERDLKTSNERRRRMGRYDFDLTIPDMKRKRRRAGAGTDVLLYGCLQALKARLLCARGDEVFVEIER